MKKDPSRQSSGCKLPRSRILRGREAFNRLFSDGKYQRGTNFNVRYVLHMQEKPVCRMGFIVSKRLGNAVKRIHAKRIMREAYRRHQHLLLGLNEAGIGFEGAMMCRKIGLTFHECEAECITTLSSIAKQSLEKHSSANQKIT